MPNKSINPIVLILMISDAVIITGFGMIEPFMAVFIKDLPGGSVVSAGIASAVFMVTKSVLQLPFAAYIDRHDHDALSPHNHRSTAFLWLGVGMIVAVPFLYYLVQHVWQLYLFQFIYGVAAALAYPTWLKLWELHMDKGRESFEWTLYSTSVSVATGAAAVIGGVVVESFGFRNAFLLAGLVSVIGGAVLIYLRHDAARQNAPRMSPRP
jgi:DHA1 family quinolone resistance protein-like MFS transporter